MRAAALLSAAVLLSVPQRAAAQTGAISSALLESINMSVKALGGKMDSNFMKSLNQVLQQVGIAENTFTSVMDLRSVMYDTYNSFNIWAPGKRGTKAISDLISDYNYFSAVCSNALYNYKDLADRGLVSYSDYRDAIRTSAYLATEMAQVIGYIVDMAKIKGMTNGEKIETLIAYTTDGRMRMKEIADRLELERKKKADQIQKINEAEALRAALVLEVPDNGKLMTSIHKNVEEELDAVDETPRLAQAAYVSGGGWGGSSNGTANGGGAGAEISDAQVMKDYGNIYNSHNMSLEALEKDIDAKSQLFPLAYVLVTLMAILFSVIAYWRRGKGETNSMDAILKVIVGYIFSIAMLAAAQQIF